ncbi:MAG: hypothetical protein COA42_21235 [Alteromonadaceae bacterium]|nr:MAG: hypothetical protein COA42_21235 [Alteromonadaceae bacterium]
MQIGPTGGGGESFAANKASHNAEADKAAAAAAVPASGQQAAAKTETERPVDSSSPVGQNVNVHA